MNGAAVSQVGAYSDDWVSRLVDEVVTVPERDVARAVIDLYQQGIVAEPAGALSVAALPDNRYGKTGCIISGGNADIQRVPELLRRAGYGMLRC